MRACSDCRWWRDAKLSASLQKIEIDEIGYAKATHMGLGYCEPPHGRTWKGLTAADYFCGEWTDKEALGDG